MIWFWHETFYAFLATCVVKPRGANLCFAHKGPCMWSFDIFFVLAWTKYLPIIWDTTGLMWRHCNVPIMSAHNKRISHETYSHNHDKLVWPSFPQMILWDSKAVDLQHRITSSNGNIFRVTGHLCWKFTGEFPSRRPVTRSFDVCFDLRLNNGWVNNREAGDLRRYRGHYDVIVMPKRLLKF